MFETSTKSIYSEEAKTLDTPFLNRLDYIEEELCRSANLIESFIDRCRGGGSSPAGAAPPTAPKMTGHFATIDRIVEQMARVDRAARELSNIG